MLNVVNTLKPFQGRMFGAPFFHVNFADFWLADQLNSLVTAMLDFQFLVCFYWSNADWMNAGGNVCARFAKPNFFLICASNCF